MQKRTLPVWFILLVFMIASLVALTGCGREETTATVQPPSATETPIIEVVEQATPFQPPTPMPRMRSYAEMRSFLVGTSIDPSWLVDDPALVDLITTEFNVLTPEVAMKFEVIHPQPDQYDFALADRVVEFAEENGMMVRGHPLVWDLQLPQWVTDAEAETKLAKDDWMALLRGHITTLVDRYRGRIYAWDVVNEAMANDGTLRDTIWLRTIGPEYIALAFRWAHEADPGALLFYNDNGAEGMNAKSQSIYAMLQGLLREGVPIHGVGLQTHTWVNGPPAEVELKENIQRIGELGLTVHITEMDVRLQYSSADAETNYADQAALYERVFRTCLVAPSCEVFSTWGPTDRHSWIPDHTGQPDAPVLFDENYQPKPAYEAIMKVLRFPYGDEQQP